MERRRGAPLAVITAGLLVAAAILLQPAAADSPQPNSGVGQVVTCQVDAQSGCTISHGLGVKPASITATAGGKAQLVSVPADKITATSYRVNFNWHNGSSFPAGTSFTFQVHFDLPVATPTPSPTVTTPPITTPPTTPPVTTPPTTPPTTPAAWSCVRTRAEGNVGCPKGGVTPGYIYPKLPNSNGYTTYVEKDCWGHPQCQYLLESNNPGDWQVTATEPAGETGVQTYPDAQQLTNNWCPNDPGFKDCSVASTDMQISQLTSLTSTYAESFPDDGAVIAQFAWDMWATNNTATGINEIMVWVDNHGRGSGGATQVGTATLAGQDWTIYRFGSTELIWSLGAPGSFAKQTSGTVDLRAILQSSIDKGLLSASTWIAQVNAGWEICSTGGVDKTFRVTDYSVTAVPN